MSPSEEILQAIENREYQTALRRFEELKSTIITNEKNRNNLLIGGVLKAYQWTAQLQKGWELLLESQYELQDGDEEYAKICFGWFLNEILKANVGVDGGIKSSAEVLKYTVNAIQVLVFNFDKHKSLISSLIFKSLRKAEDEGISDPNFIAQILNAARIRTEEGKAFLRCDNYIVWASISYWRKSGMAKKAREFVHYLEVEFSSADSEYLLNSWGWVLYDLLKHDFQGNEFAEDNLDSNSMFLEFEEAAMEHDSGTREREALLKDVLSILQILQEKPSNYSPFSNLLHLVVRSEKQIQKNRPIPNFRPLNNFLLHLDPEKLSRKPSEFKFTKNGRQIEKEGASDYEIWYSGRIRATFEIGEYQISIELATKALSDIRPLHYSNHVWFQRYQGLAFQQLGLLAEAEAIFRQVIQHKEDWFIFADLAKVLVDSGKLKEAQKYALRAKNSSRDLKFQINLLPFIAEILEKRNEPILAYKHVRLAKLFREEQGWKAPQELLDSYNRLDGKVDDSDRLNIFEIRKDLEVFWRTERQGGQPSNNASKKNGRVTSVNHQRGFGFIRATNGEDFYFHFRDLRCNPRKLHEGAEVEFVFKESPENGKNRIAIEIVNLGDRPR